MERGPKKAWILAVKKHDNETVTHEISEDIRKKLYQFGKHFRKKLPYQITVPFKRWLRAPPRRLHSTILNDSTTMNIEDLNAATMILNCYEYYYVSLNNAKTSQELENKLKCLVYSVTEFYPNEANQKNEEEVQEGFQSQMPHQSLQQREEDAQIGEIETSQQGEDGDDRISDVDMVEKVSIEEEKTEEEEEKGSKLIASLNEKVRI